MAYNFLRGDRDQPFLLPPDLRDWLPEGHLAWFILDLVDQLDLHPFYRQHRNDGYGHPAYDPKTLLGVLLYGYCVDVRSSRQLERRCQEDLAFRVLAATQTPDHVTIARFRVRHEQALAGFLVESLKLCAAADLVRLGVVALDGTKVAANAADRANRTLAKLQDEVTAILREAAEADQAEDCQHGQARGGTSSPPSWPARAAGWPGCARPRTCWRPRRPNASAAISSVSLSWPRRPRPAASNPAPTSSRAAGTRRPTPERSPTPPTPTAASCTPATAPSRATTPRPWSPKARSWSPPS
jgi:transposase